MKLVSGVCYFIMAIVQMVNICFVFGSSQFQTADLKVAIIISDFHGFADPFRHLSETHVMSTSFPSFPVH